MHAYTTDDSRTAALGSLAVLTVVLAIAANWASTYIHLGPPWLIAPPTVAAAFGLLHQTVDRFAWRWSAIRRLGFIDVPDIEGEYIGELVSSYEQTRLPVRLCIDQSWTRIAIRFDVMQPKSSTSYSMTAALGCSGHDQARLTYTYRNQTRPGVADVDMNDHDGTAEVTIDRATGQVAGRYFNFRGRQGTLTLAKVT